MNSKNGSKLSIASAMDVIRHKEETIKNVDVVDNATEKMIQNKAIKEEREQSVTLNVEDLLNYASNDMSEINNMKSWGIKLSNYNSNIMNLIKSHLKVQPRQVVNFLMYQFVMSNKEYFKELNKKNRFEV